MHNLILKYTRSDHTISIPRPVYDSSQGFESSCIQCHSDISESKLQTIVDDWYGPIKPQNPIIANRLKITESTSTARPFELASMGSCIVSAPYKGLDKWFDIGKEIIVVNSEKDCIDVYNSLLNDNELRLKMGIAARNRVKKEHTSRHRVREFIKIIKDNQ